MKNMNPFPMGLHSGSWKTRAKTLESISDSDMDSHQLFEILFASLYDQEPNVRMVAVHYLDKKINNEIIISHLENLFSAKERQIRFSAVIASETLSKEYLLPMLSNLSEKDPEIDSRIKSLIEDIAN